MFEARFEAGETLIKIVDAMKELVEDCNIDCSTTGMSMQVRMDAGAWPTPLHRVAPALP